jgi:LysR family pca operon transcriptional activator
MSKTLKELEEIIGAVLLTRNRAGVTLTREGEVFLHFAQMSVTALQHGIDGVEQLGQKGTTSLQVGALPSVAAGLMPLVLREFSNLAPNTIPGITDGPHGYLIELLRNGELDLVIGRLGPPETMQELTFTQLYNEQVVIVARPDHPLAKCKDFHELVNWPIIYPAPTSASRPLVERMLVANGVGDLPNRIETASGAFGHVYTRNSDALWIITHGVVANELTEGRLMALPLDTSLTKGPVGLVTRQDAKTTPQERLFQTALKKAITQLGLSK